MKHASIAICFTQNRTQVLVVKRKDVPIWVLPGGGIDAGETPIDAAIRELIEETGVQGHNPRHITTYHPINKLTATTYLIECIPEENPSPQPKEETAAVGFYPVNQLPQPFFFLHKEWIEDALLPQPPHNKTMISVTWIRLAKELLLHPIFLIRYLLSRLGLPINR